MNELQIPAHAIPGALIFMQNYEQFKFDQQETSRKLYVAGGDTCRYCGKKEPDVAFTDDCHALANSIGNRKLFAEDECVDCNHFFGDGIETDFGHWSLPYRVISCVKGKDGYPAIARAGWRIEATEEGFRCYETEGYQISKIDEDQKVIYFPLSRNAFIPENVYKAFVRMAISMLPRPELNELRDLIQWLRNPDLNATFLTHHPMVLISQYEYFPDVNNVRAFLYRRKTVEKRLPYMVFVLAFSNYVFQCSIPGPSDTEDLNELQLVSHPILLGLSDTPINPEINSLKGIEKVRGQIVKFNIGSLEMMRQDHTWQSNVADRAYSIWEKEGRPHGLDWKHWFEAEQLLQQEAQKLRSKLFPDRRKKNKKKSKAVS
jgi:hypothetical protein